MITGMPVSSAARMTVENVGLTDVIDLRGAWSSTSFVPRTGQRRRGCFDPAAFPSKRSRTSEASIRKTFRKPVNEYRPLSQHLCFGSGVYECRSSLLGARVLTQCSDAAAFSRFIKMILGAGPTVIETFQRIIGTADLFAKTISNPNMYWNHPGDLEVDVDDLRHFAASFFDAFGTCTSEICSKGDFAP
jgi:hypothetical protein